MTTSNDGTFTLKFIDPTRMVNDAVLEYNHIATFEGVCIVGETDQQFQIQLECSDNDVFGVRVIIDGYTLPLKKTFRKKTVITGFPQGGGDFKSFKFQRPPHDQGQANKFTLNQYKPPWDDKENDVRDYKGGSGEIIVKVYLTEQVERRESSGGGGGGDREPKPVDPFRPYTMNEKKDEHEQSLGITEGDLLPRSGGGGGGGGGRRSEMEDKILYEQIIQSFRVIYRDTSSLISKNYIKLSNHNDLQYLTQEYFHGNETAMIQILQTIIFTGQKDKPIEEVEQTLEVILQRLGVYLRSCNILDLYMSKEEKEGISEFDKADRIAKETDAFLKQFPEFFTTKEDNIFGIAKLFDIKIYDQIKKKQQQNNGETVGDIQVEQQVDQVQGGIAEEGKETMIEENKQINIPQEPQEPIIIEDDI